MKDVCLSSFAKEETDTEKCGDFSKVTQKVNKRELKLVLSLQKSSAASSNKSVWLFFFSDYDSNLKWPSFLFIFLSSDVNFWRQNWDLNLEFSSTERCFALWIWIRCANSMQKG